MLHSGYGVLHGWEYVLPNQEIYEKSGNFERFLRYVFVKGFRCTMFFEGKMMSSMWGRSWDCVPTLVSLKVQ